MELHSPAAAKRLWNFFRVAYFMMRKGLISKRKLVMDMNLFMKRGKIMSKNLRKNLIHHHHHHRRSSGYGFSLQEYEFSCSDSPNPVFFHSKRRHNHHHYFPCLNSNAVEDSVETPSHARAVPRIEYSPSPSPSPLPLPSPSPSPFSVRISNFSDEEDGDESMSREEVDDEAEQFIKRFYEQLRAQKSIALIEYQEMLARGC
ncbi:uncharacterized protein LOC109825889 [Asparagus officinalis]|uniref:uncharacterized protein LOC109825889 n=1 Tax=Asparagus officinalis TaxID=4686 RepID=UPI00098DED72|nr:uncharacterized protein LOC109825889 [Asparagus officinalis]